VGDARRAPNFHGRLRFLPVPGHLTFMGRALGYLCSQRMERLAPACGLAVEVTQITSRIGGLSDPRGAATSGFRSSRGLKE